MWVQHDLYESAVGRMFGACKERYMAAISLTGVSTELAERIRDRSTKALPESKVIRIQSFQMRRPLPENRRDCPCDRECT